MKEVQLWQFDGLGTDKDTLERVLHVFKSDGVQGMESQQALERYIRTLSDSNIRDMCEIDEIATMQILTDCFGACKAFSLFKGIKGYTTWEKVKILGWISPAAYAEISAKHEESTKRLNEEIDSLRHENSIKNYEKEEAEQQIKELQDALAHYKADLYDFYAQAGKVPNYERGIKGNEQK